jgi:hypothetical protein
LTADELNLHVASLVRTAPRPVDVSEAHDDGADPPEDAGQSEMKPALNVRTQGVARVDVQLVHLEIHETPP